MHNVLTMNTPTGSMSKQPSLPKFTLGTVRVGPVKKVSSNRKLGKDNKYQNNGKNILNNLDISNLKNINQAPPGQYRKLIMET